MQKRLIDYAGFYVGAPIHVTGYGRGINAGPWYPTEKLDKGIIKCGGITVILETRPMGNKFREFPPHRCKLLLRRLYMTDGEQLEYSQIKPGAEQTRWLLSHHFDVFGLIDAGIARDAATYNRSQLNRIS